MKNLIVFSVLLISIVPTFEADAQTDSPYTFVLKGAPSPYDSGVVIHLPQYRKETRKLKTGAELVDSLVSEIRNVGLEAQKSLQVIEAQSYAIRIQASNSARQEQAIEDLSENYKQLHAIATEPKKWYEKPQNWLITIVVLQTLNLLFSN